jgi:hypothetical protein
MSRLLNNGEELERVEIVTISVTSGIRGLDTARTRLRSGRGLVSGSERDVGKPPLLKGHTRIP